MKNSNLLILVLIIFGTMSLNAQSNWEMNSLSIFTGETPLTKGTTITGIFTKGKNTLVLDFNNKLGEVMYFHTPVKQFSFGPSIGFYKNSPWLGPIFSFEFFKGKFKTLNWIGGSFGDPEAGTTSEKFEFLFSYHQFSLVLKDIEIYYVLQHYQENMPEHIFGTKISHKISEQISLFSGLAFMERSKKYLWSMGLKYVF
jgi:hypothetical protein